MYPVDFNSCTMLDVIRRSVVCHPSLFRDAMNDLAHTHRRNALVTSHPEATRIAIRAACNCEDVVLLMNDHEFSTDEVIAEIDTSLGTTIQAFTVAARLNCLSPDLRNSIAGRHGA